jgi:fucose permease
VGPPPPRPDTGTDVVGAPMEAGRPQLFAVAVFFMLCVGMAVSFVGWVHTFAEKRGMSPGMATALTSAYWAGFLLSRVAAVVYGQRVPTARLLQGTCVGSCAAVALVAVGGTTPLVWVGTAALGAVVAPQFPTALAYLGERFALTGTAVSWCLAGASIGGTTFPYVVGRLLDSSGASVMPVAVLVLAAGLLGWFFVLRRSLSAAPSV